MKNISQKIFCAFCSLERRVYVKKSVNWTNVVLALVASWIVMVVTWSEFDARFTIFFVIFLAIAETFVRVRWRMSLPCPHCGFDPLLYKTNREEAVRRVRARLDDLRSSGQYLLRQNNPFENIPVIKVKPETRNAIVKTSDSSLSREV